MVFRCIPGAVVADNESRGEMPEGAAFTASTGLLEAEPMSDSLAPDPEVGRKPPSPEDASKALQDLATGRLSTLNLLF